MSAYQNFLTSLKYIVTNRHMLWQEIIPLKSPKDRTCSQTLIIFVNGR